MTQLVPVQWCDHVAKSDLRKNSAKDAKILRQRFERIFGLCSKCLGKELPPLSNFIHRAKKKLCGARKGLGSSLALQCYTGFVSSGFPW